MLRHLKRNAVAYLALFVALGGTSYAASQLPKNSVTSRQIKDHSVKAVDLARGVVKTGPAGAVGATGATGPKGDRGSDGAAGATGPAGPTEGVATDQFTTSHINPGAEVTADDSTLTTTHEGRLFVSKTLSSLNVTCASGTWAAWLTLDDVFVPGTALTGTPTGTVLRNVTLNGVTKDRIAAGSHTVKVAAGCVTGTASAIASGADKDAAIVVLGN